ncbi:MAG TPA: sigma 54-interacting transcriptional regulator [Candidatus Binatia bacterium]|nr:sigma 54-interacting transcriptional regulator [Candidatus Binatia bacterium]
MSDLRILILEDAATDAELIARELQKGDLTFTGKIVATREAFCQELAGFAPHLVLSDYSLPGFDGSEALAIAKDRCPDVPFVFVSGAIGEERAIETLKQGATDYVLKQRLSRLVPSVRRALSEAEERGARLKAEKALRQSEEKHRVLLEINNAIVTHLDRANLFEAIAQAVGKAVSFDRMSLALLDRKQDVLRIYGLAGDEFVKRPLPLGAEFPRQGSHLAPILDERRPHMRRDLQSERRVGVEEQLFKAGLRSTVAVPLIAQREPFGTLNFGSRSPDAYSVADAEFLMEVSQQVALAVQNMLAYEQITELKARLERENLYLQEEIKTQHKFQHFVGQSSAIGKVLKAIETVAPTDANVLILGETGTGKELVARAIHELSPVGDKALVKVNCAALPSELIESELFGHEKGAFTGALSRKIGRFELADGGTIFLDEIGDLPLHLQAKLLRVLQEGEFERVGGTQTTKVQVRVIAATNRELANEVRAGKFRSDLFYRLNVFPLEIPPLRARRADIPLLVDSFLTKYAKKLGKHFDGVSQATMDELLKYSWPGNVRELQNVVEHAAIVAKGPKVSIELGPGLDVSTSAQVSSHSTLRDVERAHILRVLKDAGWRISGQKGAATVLGLHPSTLQSRMQKLGIKRTREAA